MISDIQLEKSKDQFSPDEDITINVRFSVTGEIRDSFTEKNWTDAYNQNDNTIKLKYGIKLSKSGLRKHDLGKPIDDYRKASIFWTRNPKLVNPMKEKRIWVQVAKNFEPFIRLTEEEVGRSSLILTNPISSRPQSSDLVNIRSLLRYPLHGKHIPIFRKGIQKINQKRLK